MRGEIEKEDLLRLATFLLCRGDDDGHYYQDPSVLLAVLLHYGWTPITSFFLHIQPQEELRENRRMRRQAHAIAGSVFFLTILSTKVSCGFIPSQATIFEIRDGKQRINHINSPHSSTRTLTAVPPDL